jgi:GNAT superfamily N-acetyltransferase
MMKSQFSIAPARPEDVAQLLAMIRELAEFEHLTHLLECTTDKLDAALFGSERCVECLLGWVEEPRQPKQPVAYALFFHNYSTFLGRRGLYLEDLYVRPGYRHRGHARALLARLAAIAVKRDCGRFEWTVLDWNTGAQDVYRGLGADVMPDWRVTRLTGDALKKLAACDT